MTPATHKGECMAYNPSGYKEAKVADVGKQIDDEVTEIVEGKLSDFVKNWETFDKSGNANPEQPTINVKVKCGASILIPLPPGTEFHPKSKMAKWVNTYSKPPSKGQKVRCIMDKSGFYRIMLV